ncbi:UDP-glucuronosyl/UDP-glucosyltransferase [Macleaya cordata]|uniref:UDP-glucuronosyl/UDP-glucosyltransferase n=1 Tax=Macleaya cordata TaxID=56857 RepID=A0A200R5F4_MACCD|nr:UDP-glucuronosyl/UDP-glucosyltransferase [Macleaya cordata]
MLLLPIVLPQLTGIQISWNITSESESFVVPGLPDRIEITKAMLPENIYQTSGDLKDLCDQINAAELTDYGVEGYMKAKSDKVWCMGPVSLRNKKTLDKAERGNKASINENQCLKWLDSRETFSVVYACFGSLCRLTSSEMMEVGLGLEASGRPFVWVIRGGERYSELEKWLSEEEFEEITKDRGLVIKGWAPQSNSLMRNWFCKFWELESGRVGVDDTKLEEGEKKIGGVGKKKEEVKKAVDRVMDEGEEGEERRRVKELGERARKAMEEGGSSYFNMTLFIQDIMQHQACKELLPIQVMKTTEEKCL